MEDADFKGLSPSNLTSEISFEDEVLGCDTVSFENTDVGLRNTGI